MEIYFVTGNQNKFNIANKFFEKSKIQLKQIKLDLIEIQSDNSIEIVISKARQAFDFINKPLIITDTSWNIPALNGFPGPYMKYVNDWFQVNDFLDLLQNKKDRSIIIEDILIFYDGVEIKKFVQKSQGEILRISKGNGESIDNIVTFRKDKKTIAECMQEGISSFDEKSNLYGLLLDFILLEFEKNK